MLPLKQAIEEKHREAEKMLFNQRMIKGELSLQEYKLYLLQLLHIYAAIERFPLPHPSLNRYWKVWEDFSEIPDKTTLIHHCIESTWAYKLYLSELSQEELLPHVYLNYLAHMFGGQFIKEKVPGSGSMYEFENIKEALMSIRTIQKDEWADEVNKGLNYHIKIYDELQQISERNSK